MTLEGGGDEDDKVGLPAGACDGRPVKNNFERAGEESSNCAAEEPRQKVAGVCALRIFISINEGGEKQVSGRGRKYVAHNNEAARRTQLFRQLACACRME